MFLFNISWQKFYFIMYIMMGSFEELNQENGLDKISWELSNFKNEIWVDREKKPNVIKLKNYKIKDYWSYFSIDMKDPYWLTMKKVEWEIVFDARHEWFYSKGDVDLSDEEIIDDWNIDMINRYLKSKDMKLITDKRDIEILNKLFEKLNKIDN